MFFLNYFYLCFLLQTPTWEKYFTADIEVFIVLFLGSSLITVVSPDLKLFNITDTFICRILHILTIPFLFSLFFFLFCWVFLKESLTFYTCYQFGDSFLGSWSELIWLGRAEFSRSCYNIYLSPSYLFLQMVIITTSFSKKEIIKETAAEWRNSCFLPISHCNVSSLSLFFISKIQGFQALFLAYTSQREESTPVLGKWQMGDRWYWSLL